MAATHLNLYMSTAVEDWASLTGIDDQLGITHYFLGIIISEVLGCTEPDPRMYAAGSQSMNLHLRTASSSTRTLTS